MATKTAAETYQDLSTEQLVNALGYARNSRRRDLIVGELARRGACHRRYTLESQGGGLYGVRDWGSRRLLSVRGETKLEWCDAWDLFQEYKHS